jgi:hypothetical protein
MGAVIAPLGSVDHRSARSCPEAHAYRAVSNRAPGVAHGNGQGQRQAPRTPDAWTRASCTSYRIERRRGGGAGEQVPCFSLVHMRITADAPS